AALEFHSIGKTASFERRARVFPCDRERRRSCSSARHTIGGLVHLLELLADRFAVTDTGRVVDLATGDTVALTITSAGGPTEQTRWAIRCDALHKLRHRAIAPLVDYGAIGDAQRFEAWRCGSMWTGASAQAETVAGRASAFLRACGLAAGRSTPDAVRWSRNGAVVLPD